MTMTPSTTATIHIPTPIGDHGGSRTHDLHVSTCILTAITRFPTLRRDSQSHTGLGSYFPLSVPPQLTVSDQPPSLLRSFLLSYRGQTLPGYLASGRGYPLTAFAFTEPCWSGQRDSNPRPSAPKADAFKNRAEGLKLTDQNQMTIAGFKLQFLQLPPIGGEPNASMMILPDLFSLSGRSAVFDPAESA